jgi:hypothetical protein
LWPHNPSFKQFNLQLSLLILAQVMQMLVLGLSEASWAESWNMLWIITITVAIVELVIERHLLYHLVEEIADQIALSELPVFNVQEIVDQT